ncbi:plasmid replication DNA-binding protein [Acinetobacter lwoffii]|uniref:plasmid replication DNA-binding protein n=1 Tax=Acinetobacter lwoffii TaxID=28090 RepID=UPI00209B7B48|nr:plasmid replication DNA-binding protein [Acinetobacter lwoffii]MCO8063296.1 plasmid replication DNA-binding protein [Acinetobacter lwoffii]
MKALSVIELSKLYGMNRQSIYKRINKGDLSKNSGGKIDLAEAIRVFGEPSQRSSQNVTLQSQATQKSAELDIMRQQVDMLQKQLELAQEREQFQREELKAKNEQIESLQRLLGAPKTAEQPQQTEQVHEPAPEPIQQTPQPMPEPKPIIKQQQREPEPQKRRGLFGRVIRAVLD